MIVMVFISWDFADIFDLDKYLYIYLELYSKLAILLRVDKYSSLPIKPSLEFQESKRANYHKWGLQNLQSHYHHCIFMIAHL